MCSTLVVGASRGIGLALVEDLLQSSSDAVVFATVRDTTKAAALSQLAESSAGRLVLIKLDMVDEASIKDAVNELTEHTRSLTTVIVNGAVFLGAGRIEELTPETLLSCLETNIVGPHNVIRAFAPFLLASTAAKRTLAIISSMSGSITYLPEFAKIVKNRFDIDYLLATAYSVSKSGVNMLGRQWADSLEPKGIRVSLIHPGEVKTDMNWGPGTMPAEESAKAVLSQLENLDGSSTSMGMLSYDGTILPW